MDKEMAHLKDRIEDRYQAMRDSGMPLPIQRWAT
jgi:hypothetical protein